MSKLDDLHTLQRLLKEFEFPVSPILEYAIKEKMEKLSSADENPVSMPVVEIEENEGMLEVSVQPSSPKKKKPSILRVIRADGTIIERAKAAVLPIEIHPVAQEVLIVQRLIIQAQSAQNKGRGEQQHGQDERGP